MAPSPKRRTHDWTRHGFFRQLCTPVSHSKCDSPISYIIEYSLGKILTSQSKEAIGLAFNHGAHVRLVPSIEQKYPNVGENRLISFISIRILFRNRNSWVSINWFPIGLSVSEHLMDADDDRSFSSSPLCAFLYSLTRLTKKQSNCLFFNTQKNFSPVKDSSSIQWIIPVVKNNKCWPPKKVKSSSLNVSLVIVFAMDEKSISLHGRAFPRKKTLG